MKNRTILWMIGFLVIVCVAAGALFRPLAAAFLANPVFNGMIVGVLLIGIGISFLQVLSMQRENDWVEARREGLRPHGADEPRMLAPLARILAGRQGAPRISAMVMRSLLDGVRLRLDQNRDIARYLVGLLIFLGLLGTFWGLLDTVVSAGKVIAGLKAAGADVGESFARLRDDLQAPLAGMGTAFSSSLFGLAGALVLGFLDLQAGHAENRFFKALEDWLAELTHLPSAIVTEGEGTIPAYVEALLEKTADSLEGLGRIMTRGEEERTQMRAELLQLTQRLTDLTDQMRAEQQLVRGLARQQQDLHPVIGRLAAAAESAASTDEALRDQLKSLEATMKRVMEEGISERRQFSEDLRDELRLLTRTLAGRSAS
ncbi:MAG: hypothetical protein AMJ64_13030 [Betaproteobacteria bacterium SG8_39]|nr:MAG: hypothetical protein AMJ64_13030 [Betaproteobacteria bacterium SG8_39]